MLQPQHIVSKSIEDIRLNLKCKWNVPGGVAPNNITGCVLRSDGKIILADSGHNKRVIILTLEGLSEKEITFSGTSYPTDVTCVDDRIICVSFRDSHLQLIDMDTFKTMRNIVASSHCCGLSSGEGHLIWYEESKGIQMKQKLHGVITTLSDIGKTNTWSYVTMFNDKVYQTHRFQNKITCFKTNGEKVWELRDKTLFRKPLGVTVDNDGNIYMTSSQNKVILVSADGKSGRKLLGKSDGLNEPYCLYFDRNRNILLIANFNGEIFLYDAV